MAEEIKSDNIETAENTENTEKTENIKNTDKPDKSDKPEKIGKGDKPDKTDKSAKKVKKTAVVKTAGKSVKEKPKFGERVKKFIRDYRSELKKIVWPTRAQVIKNTGVVLVAIIFMSIVIGLLDLLFGLGLQGLGGVKNLIGGG